MNLLFSFISSFSSVKKLDHAPGSWIIETRSLQSVAKTWHIDICSMDSISHERALSFAWSGEVLLRWFLVPNNWISPRGYRHVHTQPPKSASYFQEPSIMHLSEIDTCLGCCVSAGISCFWLALNQVWHSDSTCQTVFNGSMSIPLNNLSFLAF